MTSRFLSPLTFATGRALLVWTLRDAPTALLDEVFEHDAGVRDRFLRDWSGGDLLVAAAWERTCSSRALRVTENLLTRLTENGEQDVHWYALRPVRFGNAMYAVFYVNFDVNMMLETFAHQEGCLCALCSRQNEHEGSATEVIELASASIM